jgi:hypothetical protein
VGQPVSESYVDELFVRFAAGLTSVADLERAVGGNFGVELGA